MSFVGEILTMTEKGSVIAVKVKEDDLMTSTPGAAQSLSSGHQCAVSRCVDSVLSTFCSTFLIIELHP